jgi:phytanoyl-CoA hydroxylase
MISPMQLSKAQEQSFHQEGFLLLPNFVDPTTCQAILARAKEDLYASVEPLETEEGYQSRDRAYRAHVSNYESFAHEKERDKINHTRRLRQVYDRDPLFQAWMKSPKIRPILKTLLRDEVVLVTAHHNSIMTKMPRHSNQTSWHQDRRYWHYSDENLISVWLALDSEDAHNGALEFIPKSHKASFVKEQFDEKEYFREDHPTNQAMIATKLSVSLRAGDVVLFHASLLHRANKNSTNHPKIAFVYTVKGASTHAIAGSRSAKFPEIPLF